MSDYKSVSLLDPRTKLILWALANITVFMFSSNIFPIMVMSAYTILFIISGKQKCVIGMIVAYAAILVFEYFVLPFMGGQVATVLSTITYFKVIFPCFMGGRYIIETTSVGQMMASFRAMKIPDNISIALAATLRFLPAVKEQFREIRFATKLRNIRGFGNKMECIYVPMLAGMANIAGEVSESAIARGVENPGEKSSWAKTGVKASDIFFVAIFALITLGAIIWKLK